MAIKAAKLLRILSVPPVMAAVFLLLLYRFRPDVVASPLQLWAALGCLCGVPLLAYPLSWLLHMGRERQRTLAMLLSAAVFWASLRSGRHTAGEYLWGSACCLCAGLESYLVLALV